MFLFLVKIKPWRKYYIIMSQKEASRYDIIKMTIKKKIKIIEATEMLNSDRYLRKTAIAHILKLLIG